jgi:phosphoribosylformylglycinamidine synthase subunit PurQ / glutaminase
MIVKFGVVVFPGSNCDHDAYYSLKKILGYDVTFLWHKDNDIKNCDAIILPGGFSYGDYLRTGAVAKFSPIMKAVTEFALSGGFVLGICNGFQILLEAGLLPGVMVRNKSLRFVCKDVHLSVVNKKTPFTEGVGKSVLNLPVAHGEGNYFADNDTLQDLIRNNQIVFRYSSSSGVTGEEDNFNGSTYNIAGIINKEGNILGMMPHPERCCDPVLGKTDGAQIFKSLANFINTKVKTCSEI